MNATPDAATKAASGFRLSDVTKRLRSPCLRTRRTPRVEPTAAPPPGGDAVISLTLVVDAQAETARITNTGTASVELAGWRFLSVRGNQVLDQFAPGFSLNARQSVTITSVPNAQTGSGFLRWTDQNIWNNSGDPGQPIDPDGNVVAESGS